MKLILKIYIILLNIWLQKVSGESVDNITQSGDKTESLHLKTSIILSSNLSLDKSIQSVSPASSTITTLSQPSSTLSSSPSSRKTLTPRPTSRGKGGRRRNTLEDNKVRREFGGRCLASDWHRCRKIKREWGHEKIDCYDFPPLCLKSGWTVNKCHILCMAKCNRALLKDYRERILNHEGICAPEPRKS